MALVAADEEQASRICASLMREDRFNTRMPFHSLYDNPRYRRRDTGRSGLARPAYLRLRAFSGYGW